MNAKQFISQVVDFLNVMFSILPTEGKARKVLRMTPDQLLAFLLNWNFGAQPASIQYVTTPDLIAEGREKFGKVTKVGAVQGMIGYSYENSVNKQKVREGQEADFVTQPLWGGYGEVLNSAVAKRKVTKTVQKDKVKSKVETGEVIFYLRYKYENTLRGLHYDRVLNFIPKSVLKQYLKPYYAPKSQGVENEVHARTLKLENIRRLRFKGMEIQVIPV